MSYNIKPTFVLMASLMLAGCNATTANLFPLEGPMVKTHPTTVLVAKVSGILGNTGDFSLTYPNGVECKGKWSSAAPRTYASGSGSLIDTYGNSVQFSGVSSGIKAGVNRGEAFALCKDGKRIEVEFYTGSGTANGYGVAKDSDNNVFKMIF